jgi:hypothetical protein
MAFTSKNTIINNNQSSLTNQGGPLYQHSIIDELSLEEIEFLLKLLGNADLKGHQIEMFYNMTVKLQNLYLQKSK